jgi:hypothetical protein
MRFAMEVQRRKLWTLMFRATEVILVCWFGLLLWVVGLGCSLCVRVRLGCLCLSLLTYFSLECQFLAYMADNRTYSIFLYQCYIEYNLYK